MSTKPSADFEAWLDEYLTASQWAAMPEKQRRQLAAAFHAGQQNKAPARELPTDREATIAAARAAAHYQASIAFGLDRETARAFAIADMHRRTAEPSTTEPVRDDDDRMPWERHL